MFFLSFRKGNSVHKKCNIKNYQEIAKQKQKTLWCLIFFWILPLARNRAFPRAIFDGNCDVSCTLSTLQKRAVFLPPGGGWRHRACPHIAKAKATPHAMRFNMPGINMTRANFLGRRYTSPQPYQIQLVYTTLTQQNKNM